MKHDERSGWGVGLSYSCCNNVQIVVIGHRIQPYQLDQCDVPSYSGVYLTHNLGKVARVGPSPHTAQNID